MIVFVVVQFYGSINSKRAHPPPPGICRAFSNFSFPRVGHLLKQVSPGVGHCQSNLIFRILKVVHNTFFIIKFPDYPQYKNIKTELINVIWVDPALFKWTGTYLHPHTYMFRRSQGPPLPAPLKRESTCERKDGGKKLRQLCGQDIEFSYKMGLKACTATTSCFRTLRVTFLGLSTNFPSCISVVGLVWRICK